jgi:hypothetical protein
MSVYDRIDEEGKKSGQYLKMLNTPEHPADEKCVTILKDAVENTYELALQFIPAERRNDPNYDRKRTEFNIQVRDEISGEELTWSVRQKDVMKQVSAIVKRYKLSSLVGQKLRIQTHGADSKKRVWTVLYIEPVPTSAQQPIGQVLTSPATPVAPTQAQDPGVAWVEGQKAGAAQGSH